MGRLPVALQVYSVRDFAEQDFKGTIAKIKEMGYDGVELAGLYGLTPEQVRDELAANELKALSAHVGMHEFMTDMEGTVNAYATIGCQYVAIPSLAPDMRPGAVDFDKTLETIKRLGPLCKEKGMTLLYHNHSFEFEKLPDGRFGLDCLYESVSADVLQTEIDTCWVLFAGQSPVAYINKYAGRCPVVHLKDYWLKGDPEKRGGFQFRPVGHGIQDFPAILEASLAAGAKWVVVEQDMAIGQTSLEAAQMSRDYLKSQGW